MKIEKFGITVEEPNFADTGAPISDKEIRRWIGWGIEDMLKRERPWASLQSGNATVYVMSRDPEYAREHPYHIIIFRGREAYVANLTQEQAGEILTGGKLNDQK